ncbi:MAG: hypothetical protein PUH66_09610 [Bacteroidales bacterium]|nr:hypothetical protein [Bacteroidales bacterium]
MNYKVCFTLKNAPLLHLWQKHHTMNLQIYKISSKSAHTSPIFFRGFSGHDYKTDPLEAHHLLAAGAMSLAVKKNEDLLEDFGMIVNLFVILLNIINHSLKIYFSWNRNCRNWRPFLNFMN